jgi:hypothetical protein
MARSSSLSCRRLGQVAVTLNMDYARLAYLAITASISRLVIAVTA